MTTNALRPETRGRCAPILRVALGLAIAATLITLLVSLGGEPLRIAFSDGAPAGDYAPWVDGP